MNEFDYSSFETCDWLYHNGFGNDIGSYKTPSTPDWKLAICCTGSIQY